MARLLIAALRAGGHAVEVASGLRSFLPAPEPDAMRAVEARAAREVERLGGHFAAHGPPDLWFTYHGHYKAPDFLGPHLTERFGRPYAMAEASHAAKRAAGPWAPWHTANAAAVRAAALHLCFTPRDAEGLDTLVAPDRIVPLPPFIAAGPEPAARPGPGGPVRLVTVAMMRPGDKLRSFAALAEALGRLPPEPRWRLTLVGDGPERGAVRALFDGFGERVAWAGERDAAGVAATLAGSDLYVWPGIGEAYGMSYLEAAAAGLPVLAMASGGVASVVADGETGLLTPEGDVAAHADALARLIGDPRLRARLGAAGRRMAAGERTVERAAEQLAAALSRFRAGERA